MSDPLLLNIENRLAQVEDARHAFEEHLRALGTTAKDVPGSLTVDETGTLDVECLGHTFTAVPRNVLIAVSTFAVEYTFSSHDVPEAAPVWQFYLLAGNHGLWDLATDPAVPRPFCTSTHPGCVEAILSGVALCLLDSPLLKPMPIQRSTA